MILFIFILFLAWNIISQRKMHTVFLDVAGLISSFFAQPLGFGLVLLHIKQCRLFKAKSILNVKQFYLTYRYDHIVCYLS